MGTTDKPPPPVISMGGYQRIRRYGRTNGRTFDLPRESVGGRISGGIGPIAVVPTLLGRTIFSLFDIFEQCQRITIGRCAWGVCVIEASGGLLTAGSQIRVHKPLNGLLDLLLTSLMP